MTIRLILCAVIGYLLGSISTGILISDLQGRDIRKEGSHNTGATNALRVLGLKSGLITFIGDALKAAMAVGIGLALGGHHGGMVGGLTAVIGHNWPVFFEFKGGKGIACSCTVLLMLYPVQGFIAIVLCLIVIAATKYVSLGSLTMLVSFAVLLLCTQPVWPSGVWAVAIAALGILRHHGNIGRLMQGKENKISFKRNKKT